MRSKSPELDQIRTEVADINQAHFCVFLRSSATVVLPTYQSSARISSKTTQTSSFGSSNTSLIASVTRFEISSFSCCERPSMRRMFTNGIVPPGPENPLAPIGRPDDPRLQPWKGYTVNRNRFNQGIRPNGSTVTGRQPVLHRSCG